MCLDRKHPICEKNIPKILPAVRSRILQYINVNPNNKNTRNMKILLMAVDSLLTDKNEVSFYIYLKSLQIFFYNSTVVFFLGILAFSRLFMSWMSSMDIVCVIWMEK